MDLKHIIQKDYQEAVAMLSDIPRELKESLKSHERVPKFLNNLTKQISELPPRLRPDRVQIKKLVYDFTQSFVHLIKKRADEMALSDIVKQEQIRKAQELKDLEATANGTPSGVYEELIEKGKETTAR